MTIYNYNNSACYRCLYPECPKGSQMMSCRNDGVIGMAPGIVGQILANQCLKLILGFNNILCNKLLLINLLTDDFKVVKIRGKQKQ